MSVKKIWSICKLCWERFTLGIEAMPKSTGHINFKFLPLELHATLKIENSKLLHKSHTNITPKKSCVIVCDNTLTLI